jgi:hypothetical protein
MESIKQPLTHSGEQQIGGRCGNFEVLRGRARRRIVNNFTKREGAQMSQYFSLQPERKRLEAVYDR